MSRYRKGERASRVCLDAHEGAFLRKKDAAIKKGGPEGPPPRVSAAEGQFTETDARLSLSSSTIVSGTAGSRVAFSNL
jgi:hypothetical protein